MLGFGKSTSKQKKYCWKFRLPEVQICGERECVRACVRACLRARARARVCVCVCVCGRVPLQCDSENVNSLLKYTYNEHVHDAEYCSGK